MKKAIKSDPGEKTRRFVGDTLPHSGSGSGLMAFNFSLGSHTLQRQYIKHCQGFARPRMTQGDTLLWRVQKRHDVAFEEVDGDRDTPIRCESRRT